MSWAAVAIGVGGVAGAAGTAMSQPKNKSTLTWGQKKVSDELGQFLREQLFQTEHGYTQAHTATKYGGQFTAPLMPQYGQALDLLSSWQPASISGKQQNQWQELMRGQPAYQAKLDPTTTAKYFDQAVTSPMMHTWNSVIAPQINEGFAGVGAFSSRQGQAKQQSLSDLQSNLTGQLGQFQLSNQQEQERLNSQLAESAAQRSLQAIGAYGQQQLSYANQPLLAAGAYHSILQSLQARQDQEKQAQYQDFLRTAPENNPWVGQMLAYTGQQQQAAVQQPNYLGSGIQGAGGGLSIWQALNQNQNLGQPQQQNSNGSIWRIQ